MTISSPNFTRLQDGVKSVDDLRVRGPLNVALAYLSGSLVTQLNSHFDAISQSVSTQITTRLNAFLATANTWTAAQTTQLTAAGTALTLRSTDAGAGQGPDILLDRASATPAANDFIGNIVWNMRDAAGNQTFAAQILGQILDPANVSEDAQLTVWAMVNGGATQIMLIGNGVQIGGPTGGYQGVGTLNLDNALYKDGTQVVSSRVTGYGDPFGAISRAVISVTTVTTAALASFVAAIYTDLKAHGLIGN
jgi:hypothetical protein